MSSNSKQDKINDQSAKIKKLHEENIAAKKLYADKLQNKISDFK